MNAPANIREMSAVEIIDTYCNEYGSSKIEGVAVMQDYQQEITVIHFHNVIVKVQNNNVSVVDISKVKYFNQLTFDEKIKTMKNQPESKDWNLKEMISQINFFNEEKDGPLVNVDNYTIAVY